METTLSLNVRSTWIKGYYTNGLYISDQEQHSTGRGQQQGYAWPTPILGDLNILDVNLRPLIGICDLQQLLPQQNKTQC